MSKMWREPSMVEARQRIDAQHHQIVQQQIAISEIAAPTGEEGDRGEWIAQRFRTLGLANVRRDKAGNVIARRRGFADTAPVVVCAHLDTVFPRTVPVGVRQEGAVLIGPGIGDNGRGLAAMLAIAEAIDGDRLRTRAPIDFVATTGEEGTGNLRGARYLFENAARGACAAIIVDGPGDERIVTRALGSRRYRITYRGQGGHSWTAFGTPNPVHAAAIAAARMTSIRLPTSPRTTLSVSRMGGGLSVNAIPGDGWIEVDLRSSSTSVIELLDREIRAAGRFGAADQNERRDPGMLALSCDISVIGDRPCGETSRDHALVLAAAESTRLIGRTPDLVEASTDANVPISLGIPAIAIGGGGRGGNAHTETEWYESTGGAAGISRALGIVLQTASL
ncbi:MAG: M20/M25/M40 family metallo-hydrolase [Anaerolineae bacterium]|nr:M20/M25/M40 family metallo-hydrolase [Gemmatimonadaceae bacterium]